MKRIDTNYPITDWDDAYANASHIPNGESYIEHWSDRAAAFRQEQFELGQIDLPYGANSRNKLDIFWPATPPKGLVFFVHGGYWMMLDKSYFSHLANGAITAGYACVMPSYSLCPTLSIADIFAEICTALEYAAARIPGNIHLCGHSAGGHLVTSLISDNSPLSTHTASRIVKTLSISGLHDLRPLLKTRINETLKLDKQSATALSPALNMPKAQQTITCWVGENERAEFIRQSELLATIWKSFDANIHNTVETNRHHFDIIDGLTDVNHPIMRTLLNRL